MRRILPALFLVVLAYTSICDAGVVWRHSFEKALVEARAASKPIFVDAYADWCGWCHKLDKEVYSDPRFAQFMQGFVPVKMDVEDGKEGSQFGADYHIDGLPTLLVTDSNGNVTNRIGGYMKAEDLIQDISAIQALILQEQKNPNDLNASFRLANEYLSRDMNAQAEARFRRVLQSPNASAAQKEASQFSIALAQFYQRKLDSAEASLNTYRTNFKDGESEEDALLLLSEIYIETDSNEKARDYLKEFLQKYPHSGNVHRAKEILSLVEHDLSHSK